MDRRTFIRLCATASGSLIIPPLLRADDSSTSSIVFALAQNTGAKGKVVVVGGGMAGATVAKYLRLWGGADVEVTLVERNATYTSNIMSNLVLSGARSLSTLGYDYAKLAANYGVVIRQGTVTGVNGSAKTVALADGSTLPYDRLVLAPGIRFDDAYGLTQADYDGDFPHAWQAGPQTQKLRDQIIAMQSGNTFIMTIPAKPYRCPPGPYERACLVADYLKTAGKTGCKVIVLDENPSIQAEPNAFTEAFDNIHAGIIEYMPGTTNISVDKASRTVTFTQGSNPPQTQTVPAKVINVIPPHRAGEIAALAGVVNDAPNRWAGVNVLSYESTAVPGIHVIGDASATTQPKAGHIANQEAKVCADAIVRLLSGRQPDPAPVTNSACYSPITGSVAGSVSSVGTASWLTAVFQYDTTSQTMKPAGAGVVEAASTSSGNFEKMNVWFNTLMGDTFT